MSRKYLLPQNTKQYKANLHCHSTLSDGKHTVEELKSLYMAQGYSIIAYSDHNVMIPHTELKNDYFLPITAIEINLDIPEVDWTHAKTYHLNFFSKDEYRTDFVPFDREYSRENANKLLASASENGFLTQYNHPRWSLQDSNDFFCLDNLWSFEIFNTGCELEMINGWADYEYESTLRVFADHGKNLPVPTATDDNHNWQPDDSPYCDSCLGWSMICAERLEYDAVLCAMEQKNIYASTGPEIRELYSEDGKITVKTSPCCTVAILTSGRPTSVLQAHTDELTETTLAIPHGVHWIRIQVGDKQGRKAFTRAYYISEL